MLLRSVPVCPRLSSVSRVVTLAGGAQYLMGSWCKGACRAPQALGTELCGACPGEAEKGPRPAEQGSWVLAGCACRQCGGDRQAWGWRGPEAQPGPHLVFMSHQTGDRASSPAVEATCQCQTQSCPPSEGQWAAYVLGRMHVGMLRSRPAQALALEPSPRKISTNTLSKLSSSTVLS